MDIIIRTKAWSASIFLILALALVMAACSDSDSGEDATVRPTAAATPTESSLPPTNTPAATPMATLEPTSVPAMPETYPLEIVDMLGRSVEIPAKPARIVSISPTATEMLYIAGGTAVARDTSSTFPAEVVDLPELGGAYSPSFEAIAAQRADLILIEALSQARFLEPLSQLGPPVVAVRAASLDDITTGIKLIGQIIESDEIAERGSRGSFGTSIVSH